MTLLDRLRAATEGSRELDAEIAVAIGLSPHTDRSSAAFGHLNARDDEGYDILVGPPHYTTNLQDAVSLAKDKWCVDLRRCDDGTGYCEIRESDMTPDEADDELYVAVGPVATLPLATVIACLEAMESDDG